MFDDAFPDGEGEVEPAKGRIALFKPGNDAQGVQIVVEGEAVGAEGVVQGFFAGVAEGRMADVVYQGEGFGEFRIECERGGEGAGDLGDFEGVGKPIAEVVGGRGERLVRGESGEDLGFAGEAAEGARVEDSGGVAGEGSAVGVRRLRMGAKGERCAGETSDCDVRRKLGRRCEFEICHAFERARILKGSSLVIPQMGTSWLCMR